MSSLNDELFNCLKTVESPGDFYTSGTLELFMPQLEVKDVGRISLPLLSVQAEQLISVAEQAPYGRGQETLVDTIVKRCAIGLGVGVPVSVELYKLLVYDAGSFFIKHRDTEKTAGMFATLVIVLPSDYSGGELVVKHREQVVKLDLHSQDAAEISYAAFYADCVHEVLPITQGCRLTLIYNLIRTDKKLPLPEPPDYRQQQAAVTGLLRAWTESLTTQTDENNPEKLIYLLEHAYSQAELGFDALKNADAALADVLAAAAEQADCDIYLALLTVEESGTAEYSGYRRGYWDEDDNDFEIGEVCERLEILSEWRRVDGREISLPSLPFSAIEFCPRSAFDEIEPDDVEFQEATGNAGASFERSYHCTALVIWPRSRSLAVLSQAGLSATLPVLQDFCLRWEAEGSDKTSTLWQDAHVLAGYILRDSFAQESRYHNRSDLVLLDCLYRLGDSEGILAYWQKLAEHGFYCQTDCTILLQTAKLLPWVKVVKVLEQAIGISAIKAQAACAALLAQCSVAKPESASDLKLAAGYLFLALPGEQTRFSALQPWEYTRIRVDSELVVNVLNSFGAIDAKLADDALDYLLAWPVVYEMDKILVPAALALTQITQGCHFPVVTRLKAFALKHLQSRIEIELSPPKDWQRDSYIKCSCKDCGELRAFLDNATQSTWVFKAVEGKRKHVENMLMQHAADVDCRTECKSRPYSLICKKNQASYLRRVAQRNADLSMYASLGKF